MTQAKLVLAGALVLLAGCGSGAKTCGIKGHVTIDGQPVEAGMISFVSVQPGSPSGVGVPVIQGAYDLSQDRGLPPGTYRVEIRWPKPTGKTWVDPATNEPQQETVEAIPARYNAQSELTVEIKTSTTQDFDFKT